MCNIEEKFSGKTCTFSETPFLPTDQNNPPRQMPCQCLLLLILRGSKKCRDTTEATVGLGGIVVAHNKEEFLPIEIFNSAEDYVRSLAWQPCSSSSSTKASNPSLDWPGDNGNAAELSNI